jgi:hypothetical protein
MNFYFHFCRVKNNEMSKGKLFRSREIEFFE